MTLGVHLIRELEKWKDKKTLIFLIFVVWLSVKKWRDKKKKKKKVGLYKFPYKPA